MRGENTTTVVNGCLVSPETANAVLVEKRLNRDKNKVACKRLGDKHSMKKASWLCSQNLYYVKQPFDNNYSYGETELPFV